MKPASGAASSYAAPTIQFKDGTVYVTIPVNQGPGKGDIVHVVVTEESTGKRVISDAWKAFQQDGGPFTSWDGNYKAYAGIFPGKALVNYVVKRGDSETMSASLRIQLSPSDKDPSVMIPAVIS